MSRSFAHLLGMSRPAAPRAEETDDEKNKREDEEEMARRAEEDRKEKEDEDAKKVEDDKKKEEEEAKKAKKAEDGDDDTDEEDEADAKASAARRRERARCAAIFAHPAAGMRPDMAAELAFGTTLTRSEATNLLRASANAAVTAAAMPAQRRLMQTPPNPDVGPDSGKKAPEGAAGFAAQMARVDKIRRGEA